MNIGENPLVKRHSSISKFSIRTIIITVFLAQVLIVTFFVANLSFRNNAKSAGVLINKSLQELNSNIQEEVTDYFRPPVEINNLNERLLRENLLSRDNQAELMHQFSIEMKARNSVNSISFANAEGGLANAGIDKAKRKYYVIYTDNFKNGPFNKYAIDDNGKQTNLITSLPYFDARTRPWYINALKDSAVVWSDIYLIATGNDLGINASKAVRDKNNNLLGVVCVDLFLSDISDFLSHLDLGIGGQSFIIDKSGYLIASSKNDRLFDIDSKRQMHVRTKAFESESAVIRTVSNVLKGKEQDFSSFAHETDVSIAVHGTTYLVHAKPFNVIPSHQWMIVTVIPKATFMSQVYANNRITVYLIFVILLLSTILAIVLARMISGPILKLDKKVRDISQGAWQAENIPSHIKEIDALADEISKMHSTIETNIQSLNEEIRVRKQAESFLQDIIDKNPISIQIVDKDGYTVKVNDANAQLFGLAPPPEFCVFSDPQILGQGHGDLLERAKNGEVVYLPDVYYNIHDFSPHLPDKPIWVKVVFFPITGADGKPVRFVMMHEDVTHRKYTENALIAAKESAEENNRLKSSFLANMSHELRTPLSGILGFSELLKEQLQEDINREMAIMINHSGNRLLNTLNLILDLSQLEANMQKVTLSTFDLNLLLSNITNLFKPVADKKMLELTFTQDRPKLYIQTDANMLEHIVNELVSNALKYTITGSVSLISKVIGLGADSQIVIEVIDTGIGIPSDNQETIFDAFRQVSEGWNRSFEGTGLGLTICKKYVNLLQGNVALESVLGAGSKFTLSFPAEIIQPDEQGLDESENTPVHSEVISVNRKPLPLILLVDDDEMVNIMATKMLKNVAEIVFATTGAEGLEFIRNNSYAAVLLDINLKIGLSGLDVIKEIKNIDAYHEVPVIAITAYAMLDDKANLLTYGFTDYISKPFTTLELVTIVQKWIKP